MSVRTSVPAPSGVRAAMRIEFGAGVMQRQVQREDAALAVHARQLDLAAEQHRQLAADGQAEAGAAVLARRAGIGLLEGLEDQALLFGRDADAGVLHGEGHDLLCVVEYRVIGAPAVAKPCQRARRRGRAR